MVKPSGGPPHPFSGMLLGSHTTRILLSDNNSTAVIVGATVGPVEEKKKINKGQGKRRHKN